MSWTFVSELDGKTVSVHADECRDPARQVRKHRVTNVWHRQAISPEQAVADQRGEFINDQVLGMHFRVMPCAERR